MNLWVFWVFYEVWWRCVEDDEEDERKEEDGVFYKFLGLVPLRILFFWFPLTLWLNIWNDTPASSATSHVATSSYICHIDVFVTDDDDKGQNQNIYNLQG